MMEHNAGLPREQTHHGDGLDPNPFRNDVIPSYFQGTDNQFHQQISTIPEGSSVIEYSLPERIEKSPSPEHSLGQTTGTTSTPTSCENALASDVANDRNISPSEFHRESLQGQSPWASMPLYGPSYSSAPSQVAHHHQVLHQHYDSLQNSAVVQYDQQPQPPLHYNPTGFTAAIKLLVSNNVAASIIGRAGHTISELQAQSKTRIKLSQAGDFFPGTQDRVCLVQGESESVKVALRLILERIFLLQEQHYLQHMAWQMQKQPGEPRHVFDFIIRALVPGTICGMIIGKAGANIKHLEDTTGVSSLRLSPKDAIDAGYPTSIATATNERTMTVTASNLDQCTDCLFRILDSMAAHPDISRYTNMTTSYSRMMPETALQNGHTVPVSPVHQRHLPPQDPWAMRTMFPYGQPGLQRRFVSAPELSGIMQGHLYHHPHHFPEHHFQPPQAGPMAPARPAVILHENIHADAYPSPFSEQPSSFQLPSHHAVEPPQEAALRPRPPGELRNSMPHVHHSHSAPDLLAFQLDYSMHISDPPTDQETSPGAAPDSPPEGFVPQAPILTAPDCFIAQVMVPEQMVGSILGRGGSALSELQMLSGTRIRVSQRGEYMPGTRSRIVTIRGPTGQGVWQAQCMMSQRMVLPTTAAVAAGAVHPPQYSGGPPPTARYGPPPLEVQLAPVDPVTPSRDERNAGVQENATDNPSFNTDTTSSGSPSAKP